MDPDFYDAYMIFVTDNVKKEYRDAFANIATAKLVWDEICEEEKRKGLQLWGYDHYSLDHIGQAMYSLGFPKNFLDF